MREIQKQHKFKHCVQFCCFFSLSFKVEGEKDQIPADAYVQISFRKGFKSPYFPIHLSI